MYGHRVLIVAVLSVLGWLFGGALVYFQIENCTEEVPQIHEGGLIGVPACPWNFAQCFYFSVQTGMSIGFGLLKESKKASEVYSIFHILVGSSVVAGALGLFATLTLTRQHHFLTRSERRLARLSAALHTDGYKGFSLGDVRAMMVAYPHYARDVIRKVEPDAKLAKARIETFNAARTPKRNELATEILRDAAANLKEFKHDSISIKDLVALDAQASSWQTRLVRKVRENRNSLSIIAAFLFWVVLGTVFSVALDDTDFVTGLYFAVSTLSTAGMVSVNTVPSNFHVLFTAFYAIVGIPIYCMCLGLLANLLVDWYTKRQVEDKLQSKLSSAEIEFLGHLADSDKKEDVDVSEYIELQLLRLGIVDREMIRSIREQFSRLDHQGTGKLKKRDFLHQAHHGQVCKDGQEANTAGSAEAAQPTQ